MLPRGEVTTEDDADDDDGGRPFDSLRLAADAEMCIMEDLVGAPAREGCPPRIELVKLAAEAEMCMFFVLEARPSTSYHSARQSGFALTCRYCY